MHCLYLHIVHKSKTFIRLIRFFIASSSPKMVYFVIVKFGLDFLIGIYSIQGSKATTRYGVTKKKEEKD